MTCVLRRVCCRFRALSRQRSLPLEKPLSVVEILAEPARRRNRRHPCRLTRTGDPLLALFQTVQSPSSTHPLFLCLGSGGLRGRGYTPLCSLLLFCRGRVSRSC